MDASCTNTHGYRSNGAMINSPAYPAYYPALKSCTWTLSVPIGFEINIEPFSYDIEGSRPDCNYDYLAIYDDVGVVSTLCGTDTYPGNTSRGQNLFIVFDSDSEDHYGGFQFQLSIIGMINNNLFIINNDNIILSLLYVE